VPRHTTVAAVLMTSAMTAAVIAPLAWLAVVLRVGAHPRLARDSDDCHRRVRDLV